MYELRKIRDPLLKKIANVLPQELLHVIYLLAIRKRHRYLLRNLENVTHGG
jgi:hypothetical protein